eukprot:m51a1_g5949 hypothetical protein (459) ;mRNA; r:133019-135369
MPGSFKAKDVSSMVQSSLVSIVSNKLLPPQPIVDIVMPFVMRLLLSAMEILPEQSLRSCKTEELILQLADLQQTTAARSLACQIIGTDVDFEDEAAVVRQHAFQTLTNLATFFDPQTQDHAVVPVIKTICREPPEDLLPTLAQLFGLLLFSVKEVMMGPDLQHLLGIYRSMASRKSIDIRRWCAYNMPAVVSFVGTEGFTQEVRDTFVALCADSSPAVRRTIAAGFHEVAAMVGRQQSTQIRDMYARLLQDTPEVLEPMVDHISETLAILDNEDAAHQAMLGKSYSLRIIFVKIAEQIAVVFSRKFFKELFWGSILDLSNDRVPNMIILPSETPLLKRLNSTVVKLKNDDDNDVSAEAKMASEKFNQIECSVEKFPTEFDIQDLNKELQEEEMFDKETCEIEEARMREENERADVWRRMAEREAEIALKAKIYGKLPKSKLGRIRLPAGLHSSRNAFA